MKPFLKEKRLFFYLYRIHTINITLPENPQKVVIQSDGRIRKWAKIVEADKYLRVILLEDGETVHNAFFDRSFKED